MSGSQEPVRLSEGTRSRLERELTELRARRDELVAGSRALDPTGDRGDDAQPLQEDDDIARIGDRIDELTRLLTAGAGRPHGLPDGATVTVRFGDGTEQTLQVVAITEEIPPGREDSTITSDSPLGLALAGHQAGETVGYATPAGDAQATIVSLQLPD